MDISRHQRRMLIVQALFLWEHQQRAQEAPESALQYVWDHFKPQKCQQELSDFENERFFGVLENIEEIRKQLVETAPDWPLEKIASHDRSILYLGMFELLYTDVPNPVVINEAVELAKAFGGRRSSQFINGVLSTLHKQQS